MTNDLIKDAISHLDSARSKEVLNAVLDKLRAGEQVVAADIEKHLSDEVMRGATRALADPWRTAKALIIAAAISFVLGGAATAVLFCRH